MVEQKKKMLNLQLKISKQKNVECCFRCSKGVVFATLFNGTIRNQFEDFVWNKFDANWTERTTVKKWGEEKHCICLQ